MRRVFATIVTVVVLAGACGTDGSSGGSTEVEEATTPPPPVYTQDQLLAALPTVETVPDAQGTESICPGEESCPETATDDPSVSVSLDIAPAGDAAAAELAGASAWFRDTAFLAARQYPDASDAAENLRALREEDERRDGEFDIPVESMEDNRFRPGERGSGKLSELTIDDAEGHILVSNVVFNNPDGDVSEERFVASVVVVRGALRVSAQVDLGARERSDDEAEVLVRAVVEDFLAGLD